MLTPERSMTDRPDRMIMVLEPGEILGIDLMSNAANAATARAKNLMPKITGHLASTLTPVFGETFWGIYFPDKRTWFLERGTRPFTMNSLQGKTIPMWVDDPDGEEAKAQKNPKQRITEDGRRQTLIFRHASKKGQRKNIFKGGKWISVPRSYPGAPGRISARNPNGQIAAGNVGVRWRHPGIQGRFYINQAMTEIANEFGFVPDKFLLIDAATYPAATKY